MNNRLSNTLSVLLLLAISACSSPTRPLTNEAILELLAQIPPIPSPPATTSNQDSTGWQITTMLSGQAASLLRGYLQIYEILSDSPESSFSKHGDEYVWRFTAFVVEEYELSVIAGDRLAFTIRILDEDYLEYWYSGWISRSGKAGRVSWNRNGDPIWSNDWWQEGKTQIHRHEMYTQQGEDSIEVGGRADGSGHLRSVTESAWTAPNVFEATWDAFGHGTWWSSTNRSGGW